MDTQVGMSHSIQTIFLHLPAYSAGGWEKEKIGRRTDEECGKGQGGRRKDLREMW